MAIEVEGPDGAVIEFPDGTGADVIKGVMAKRYGGQQSASLAPADRMGFAGPGAKEMSLPEPTFGDKAADVAKSGGIGTANAGLGFATLPGNVEFLARLGIDKGAQALGYDNPNTMAGQKLPTYADAKKFVEGYTGKFYEPKTTAGKYARSVGEYLPMMANPRIGVPSRIAATLAGGLASEAAGQATEGTSAEPWARIAAGIAGTMVPGTMMRTVSPNPVPPERAQQLAVLEREGVTALTAGQRTGKRPLQWAESVTQDTPFGGTRAADLQRMASEQFTRAALQRAGIHAERATPDVMDAGFVRLGQQFDMLAQNAVVPPSRRITRDLQRAVNEYNDVVAPTLRAPIVENIVRDIDTVLRSGRPLHGEAYGALRSALDKQARATRQSNPQLSEALFSIRNSLDDAVERALPLQLMGQYRQARNEYRNLMTLEKAAAGAGPAAADGLISPALLRAAAKAKDQRGYVRGQGDLDELARAGVSIMTPLPQSGTAPRAAAQGVLHGISTAAGYGAGGIEGALAGLASTLAIPALTSRGLMSRPVQGYLGNQTLAPLYNALERPAWRSHMTVMGPMLEDLMREGQK